MIIKNNFNNKNVNPLDNYKSIGKTRDNSFDKDNADFNQNNNSIIDDILKSDHEYEDDTEEVKDNWDFFK